MPLISQNPSRWKASSITSYTKQWDANGIGLGPEMVKVSYTYLFKSYCNLHCLMDMPILTCIFFTFNWLTSEMHFAKFHPEVAFCLLSRGKRKNAPLGMRLLWKYIRNYFLVYQLISHFWSYLQNYKEFEAEILDLQLEKYGLSFDIKKCTTSGWALGDENVIGIRSFKDLSVILIFARPAGEHKCIKEHLECPNKVEISSTQGKF